ncbi:hypothetical protein BG015_000455 [Linnemannia schmuckeri]|uniref:Uncharacterized protein n=1 Tax=Linnemannia schmuckeri TaxID=64567 RepID=A0A9P5V7F4_9FUNG|nr:hypothetical protein BG015_000455 [Linnemannia schmuckeri]
MIFASTATQLRHTGITTLAVDLISVFMPDDYSSSASSLLIHFPNLQLWNILSSHDPQSGDLPARAITILNQELKNAKFHQADHFDDIPATTMLTLLLGVLEELVEIKVLYENTNPSIVNVTLTHSTSLRALHLLPRDSFYRTQTAVVAQDDQLKGWRRLIQLIPQVCSNLQ